MLYFAYKAQLYAKYNIISHLKTGSPDRLWPGDPVLITIAYLLVFAAHHTCAVSG